MGRPVFGLEFFRVDDQPQPVVGANMDVVGIVGPCDTADADTFPLNTPVLVYSNDLTKLADLYDGEHSDGYIADAINGINAQLADYEIAAQCVIVRTAYGTAGDANLKLQQTISRIMGDSAQGTGVWALKKAPNSLYCTPRIILCPGYTGQMANSLDTLVMANAGTGYIPGQEYTVAFATGNGEINVGDVVLPRAYAIADSNGEIHNDEITIVSWGAWMTVDPTATIVAPDGPAITAEQASGSIIFNANPGIGSTLVFNTTGVVDFISGTTSGLHVHRGANLSETLNELLTVLNGSNDAEIERCTYALIGGTLTIVHDDPGVSGNGWLMTGTVTDAEFSGSHLDGGKDAAASVQGTLIATMGLGANPVCTALPGVLDGLIGHAIVESAGTSQVADANWRTTLNHTRLICVSGGIKVMDPESGFIVVRPIAGRVAGLMIAEDFSTGFPGHSCANRPIQGVVGPARTINFSLTDGATEGQTILSYNLGIVARGLIGVETAISSGGFVFIGTDNMGDDELWRFYNVVRMRDYIHLSLMPALRTYLGRANITRQTIKNILATINHFLASLQALEQILGFKVSFKGTLNSAEEIRLGHLTVGFACEEPSVLRRITTMSARYKPAIDQMVSQLEQELNLGVAA